MRVWPGFPPRTHEHTVAQLCCFFQDESLVFLFVLESGAS